MAIVVDEKMTEEEVKTESISDLEWRVKALEIKSKEMSKLEEELKLFRHTQRENNWPTLPEFLPIKPCFYQNISMDIPAQGQKWVSRLYYIWIFNWVVLIANLLGGTLLLGIDDGITFGLSILYCILFIPLSYICWFRPAYNAFRNNSFINYIIFFITFSFQFCFSVLMAIGIPNTGSSGVVIAMLTFRKRKAGTGDYFFGTIILFITLGFSLAAAMQLFIILKVHKFYRRSNRNVKVKESSSKDSIEV